MDWKYSTLTSRQTGGNDAMEVKTRHTREVHSPSAKISAEQSSGSVERRAATMTP